MKLFDWILGKKINGNTTFITTTSPNATAIWSDKNYEVFCKETYLKNVIAFRCISIIAQSIASVPWKIFEVKKDGFKEELVNHPLYKVIRRPNPQQGWASFMQWLTSYLIMAGNSYVRKIGPLTGPNKGMPSELYVLQPNGMKLLSDTDGNIVGFEYQDINRLSSIVKNYKFLIDPITGKSEILHLKSFNPIDKFFGAATTEPLAREIDTSNAATEWNKKLLDNEARPGLIVTFTKNLNDQQYERMKRQFEERHSGPKNAGKNLIIEGAEGTKVEPHGFTPAEMDFISGNQELARRICLGYGVPSMLLGIPGDNTYSNYKEARLAFWEETVFFYLKYFKTEFNHWLLEDSTNVVLDYDLEHLPALAIKRDQLWERAQSADYITINEKREMVGMEKIDGGDVILVPVSSMPLETMVSEGGQAAQGEGQTKLKILKRGYNEEDIDNFLGENL